MSQRSKSEKGKPPARLTVVAQVYHQRLGKPICAVPTKWDEELTTEEQPYDRTVKVGSEWRKVDYGWAAEAGTPVLVVLSREDAEADVVVQVAVSCALREDDWIPFTYIRIGRSFDFEPDPRRSYAFKAWGGEAKIRQFVVPR